MQTNSPNGGKQAERARVTAMPEGANKDAQREQHQATRDAEHPRNSSDYSPAPWGSNPLGSFHQLTREMDEWMKTTENPHYEGFFLYGDRKPHCWSGPLTPAERIMEMAQFIASMKPEGATTPWWP